MLSTSLGRNDGNSLAKTVKFVWFVYFLAWNPTISGAPAETERVAVMSMVVGQPDSELDQHDRPNASRTAWELGETG